MSVLSRILHDDEVTIERVTTGLPDDDGTPTETTVRSPWKGVSVQQMTSKDLADAGRDTRITTWRVSGPPVQIDGGDKIIWRGATYRVDGEPDTRRGRHRINHTALLMVKGTG